MVIYVRNWGAKPTSFLFDGRPKSGDEITLPSVNGRPTHVMRTALRGARWLRFARRA